MTRPGRGDAAEYYFTYIDQVGDGDILETLEKQGQEIAAELAAIPAEKSHHRYEPGKWSIREVLGHINDTERLFVFRAFWFARGFDTALPSFDQNIAAQASAADFRTWASLVEEFRSVRAATVSFFRSLPSDAWARRGIASDNPFTVKALAFLAAGHAAHHMGILRARYL